MQTISRLLTCDVSRTLDEMLAKVPAITGKPMDWINNQLWVLAGAAEDGSIRSALYAGFGRADCCRKGRSIR
ncbi:MAG: hypothetical protein V8Q23_06305 [Eubacteriales bacterium]